MSPHVCKLAAFRCYNWNGRDGWFSLIASCERVVVALDGGDGVGAGEGGVTSYAKRGVRGYTRGRKGECREITAEKWKWNWEMSPRRS